MNIGLHTGEIHLLQQQKEEVRKKKSIGDIRKMKNRKSCVQKILNCVQRRNLCILLCIVTFLHSKVQWGW